MAGKIRVLLADDHWVVRDGLRTFLSGEPDIEVVDVAVNGVDAVARARASRPDVVVMDLAMPGGGGIRGGIEATATIRRDLPRTQVVVLTSAMEDEAVVDAVKAGAAGFVLKESRGQDLVEAIRAAADGRIHLSAEVTSRLARAVAATASPDPLSPRELEVLGLVVDGLANKQIARSLGISEKTVKGHLSNIFQKLGVATRTQAALHALSARLLKRTPT